MECVFCNIIAKKLPAQVVFENEDLIAFKNIKPEAPLHYLVVPKQHIESIAHLEGNHREVLAQLIYTAKDLAKQASLAGYKLIFNVGREGGQVIDHLHLHLLGGWNKKQK